MLFESLVTKKRGDLPSRRASNLETIAGIHIVSNSNKVNRSALGGAVLIASKVLRWYFHIRSCKMGIRSLTRQDPCFRSLALLAAYRSLSAGLSPAVFASSTLALASVVLITLQQPWKGKSVGYSIIFKLLVQVRAAAEGRPHDGNTPPPSLATSFRSSRAALSSCAHRPRAARRPRDPTLIRPLPSRRRAPPPSAPPPPPSAPSPRPPSG
jgi:hypothetical protein